MQACGMNVRDRVVLITGAARGIGRATAMAMADAGARLIVCDVNEAALDELAQELSLRGQLVLSGHVDVANREQMRDFAERVHALVPAVDVLINNAGVGLSGTITSTRLEDWDWVLGVNLHGVIHGCHFFVPKMIARGQGGHVVNVSSAFGYFGGARVIGYVTSKFAVFGLSESLRNELVAHGIGVSTICPGVIDTDIPATTRIRPEVGRSVEALRTRVMNLYRKRSYPPERVASSIVAAVRAGRPVVPVTPEAWVLWIASRLSSRLSGSLGRLATGNLLE